MKLLTRILYIGGILFSNPGFANAEPEDLTTYSARIGGGQIEAATRFDCSDSIYVFVQTSGAHGLRATAEARWTNPSGNVVRTVVNAFEPMSNGGQYAWDGIDIEAGGGAFSNMLGAMFDPAAGYEDAIGNWRVDIHVDGIPLQPVNFQVLC
jgi:hypothetical protein